MTDKITIEREPLERAVTALVYHQQQTRPIERTQIAIRALRAALAAQPAEPVAWRRYSARHGWIYEDGITSFANDPSAEPLYAAPPAPAAVPLDSLHAELWRLAVRKGIVTVRSELIDDRNPDTRCSWMQGNDKACDISNDAAKVAGDRP